MKRRKPEQIVALLHQVDAALGHGKTIEDICRYSAKLTTAIANPLISVTFSVFPFGNFARRLFAYPELTGI
ncbi:MAG: hypothetical protein Fur0043_21500 [Anaerolineales bacterium]